MLLVHGMLNQFGIRLVALLNDISVWWHILGVLIIVGVLAFAPIAPPDDATTFHLHREQHRLASIGFYVLLLGLLTGAVHLHRVRRLRAHD